MDGENSGIFFISRQNETGFIFISQNETGFRNPDLFTGMRAKEWVNCRIRRKRRLSTTGNLQ
jgi:hypothetical protein